jgi:hypothetical protein
MDVWHRAESNGGANETGIGHLKRITRQIVGLAACLVMVGCVTQAPRPVADARHLERQSQRVADAERQLASLEAVDLQLEIDNAWLAAILEDRVRAGLGDVPGWSGTAVDITFYPGYVALDVSGRYDITAGNPAQVSLAGDLVPYFQPDRLLWHVDLHDLVVTGLPASEEAEAASAEGNLPAIPPDEPALIETLETALRASMTSTGLDEFQLGAMPLGILETGIRVRAPFQLVRAESSPLSGLLTVRQSAALITPDATRMALDLGFIPERPACAPAVGIGRAVFAFDVRNREPVDPARTQAAPNTVRVFFTDVLDTREPTTVIHYWFADGRPVSVVELEVQPSARWRTWSAAPSEPRDVDRWQVLVLEKDSGCVLAHRMVEVERPLPPGAEADAVPAVFDALAADFEARAPRMTTIDGDQAPVRFAIDRSFFAAALSESMYDLRLTSTASATGMPTTRVGVSVGATPTDSLTCTREQCDSGRACTLNYDNCPIQQDTRDCTSCLIRNPLNNRCMREAEDPICLAARDNENARLEERREACIGRETALRDSCLRERDRELAACQRRATQEVSACAAEVDELATRFQSQRPVATITGDATLDGQLEFEFGEFRLDEDLSRVQMLLSINADLTARGTLSFEPAPDLGVLDRCLRPFSDAYDATLALAPWQGGLVTNVTTDDSALVANWSGLIQRLEAAPPPVAEFVARHEDALAECAIGIDPDRLLGNLSGPGTALLRGIVDLDLQPEPTRITLLPAHLSANGQTWTGEARITTETVEYRLGTRLVQDQAVTQR